MSWYRPCPCCGSNLDPGEACEECRKKEAAPVVAEPETAVQEQSHAPSIAKE